MFSPWWGTKSLHIREQLSLHATPRELAWCSWDPTQPNKHLFKKALDICQAVQTTKSQCGLLFLSHWRGESVSEVAQSCLTLYDPITVAYQAPPSMEFSRQEYWSGLPFTSPGDLPNPGINPGLPHCRQTLYCLSYQRSPKEKKTSAKR